MAYLPGMGYIGSPQDLLQNEWVIFAAIFLLTFAIVYFSISKFFSSEKKAGLEDLLRGKGDKTIAHPTALIVSLVIALFTSAAASRAGPFYEYFANVLGAWMLIFIIIVMVIISLPFFKAIKYAFGNNWFMGLISGVVVAVTYWNLVIKSDWFYNSFAYSAMGWSESAYSFLTSSSGLIVLILGFAFLGAVLPATRRV
jgi:hypothetical protein